MWLVSSYEAGILNKEGNVKSGCAPVHCPLLPDWARGVASCPTLPPPQVVLPGGLWNLTVSQKKPIFPYSLSPGGWSQWQEYLFLLLRVLSYSKLGAVTNTTVGFVSVVNTRVWVAGREPKFLTAVAGVSVSQSVLSVPCSSSLHCSQEEICCHWAGCLLQDKWGVLIGSLSINYSFPQVCFKSLIRLCSVFREWLLMC